MEKKVLFTASTLSHIQHFHLPYLNAFHNLGWNVHVACGGPNTSLPAVDKLLILPFQKQMTSLANFQASFQLRRLIQHEDYNLIIVHTSLAAFFTRLATKGLSKRPPIVNVVHGYLFDHETPPLKRSILLAAERLTAPQTDLLLAMNQWDYDFARKKRLGTHIAFIPGIGVNFSSLGSYSESERLVLRQEQGFRESNFLFIYAAEFSKRKHQETLIRALALLPEHIGLLLPGEGELRQTCMKLAKELHVDHRIAFPGQVSNMSHWYSAADGAVSSSRSEGLPFNIMEAMYRSLPVAATEVKGHTDLIEHGKTGLLFPFGDEAQCAASLASLAHNAALRNHLARSAHERVCTQYGLDSVLPVVMELYLSVCSTP